MSVRKIVIFGKGEAGKSTFIGTIIPDAININHRGRTIALDFGTYRHNGKVFHFYGTPGQARFDCLRDILAINAHHALMIFDSSLPLEEDDRNILQEVRRLSVPFTGILNLKEGRNMSLSETDVANLCRRVSGYQGLYKGDVRNQDFVISILNAL
jgi:hypothetical protein